MSFTEYSTTEAGAHENRTTDYRSGHTHRPGDQVAARSTGKRVTDELTNILDRNGFRFIVDHQSAAWANSRLHFAPEPERTFGVNSIVPSREGRTYHAVKRALDIIVASTAILLLLPVMLIIATAIMIEDGAPIVYHQLRTGQDGKNFRFFKFRSMVKNADKVKEQLQQHNEATGPIFKMKNDPRITRVGRFIRKTSLDELPQLINVLRGEMSVIGPRPLYAPEASALDQQQYERHNVQPGLLCLREVCGRSELTFDQWMELDLVYVSARSLRTDLTIMLRAIPAILSSQGAY